MSVKSEASAESGAGLGKRSISTGSSAHDEPTLFALQRLEQGKLQRLGDSLLPWKYPELVGLKSNGLTDEAKTRKGVPDSFVGASAADCRAAVEYTTQATTLATKLGSDYASVRTTCPKATCVFLCTNRQLKETDVAQVRHQAKADGVQLVVVDGGELADALATERQDLREQFLAIPIGAHSRDSLISAMAQRLTERIPSTVRTALSRRILARPSANRALHRLLASRGNKIVLATAVAGTGKSTWSAYQAEARAETQPVVWTPANALRWEQPDPIGLHIVQTAFGVADASRAHQLVDLLRREQVPLLVVLDGIDEVQDFASLLHALQAFQASAFAPLTAILTTCREEALAQLATGISAWRPELLDSQKGTRVRLDALTDKERRVFLSTEGATREETRRLEGALPAHLRSVPLFLKQSLAIVRAGGDPTTDNIVDSFAKFAVRDIAGRMRHNGIGPSEARIADYLRDLATEVISSPIESLDYAEAERVGNGLALGEGENSLIGRSTQAGLLEARGERGLGFTHALYLEYFAGKAAINSWPMSFPELQSDRGKQIARRIFQFVADPAWLIDALLPIDAATACFCAGAATALPSALSARLISALDPLLASRFTTDRTRALNLLGTLRNPSSGRRAITWWNAADERTRLTLAPTAARVFLRLEIPEAFEIILSHHWFHHERAWYEPSFLAGIAQKAEKFRQAMVARAHQALSEPSLTWKRRATLVTMLAMFGDREFVEMLASVVEAGGHLCTAELRALLHANTVRAMEVYGTAVDNSLSISLESEAGADDREREQQRNYRRDALIPNTADVRMYPTDAAIALAEAALSSARFDHVSFGLRLALLLNSEALLPAYMSARRRRTGHFIDLGPRLVDGLVQEASFVEMKSLFDANHDVDIRRAIVASAHAVPGGDTERFLLGVLEIPEYRFGAAQSLGLLHARRAGPAILRLYEVTDDDGLRHVCIRALGQVGYRSAVPALANHLSQVLALQGNGDQDDEYELIHTLGDIGGDAAQSALVSAFPKTQYRARTLQALFKTHAEGSLDLDLRILHEHDVDAVTIAQGLGAWEMEDLQERDRVTPVFRDGAILARLIENAREVVNSGQPLINYHLLRAIARFDLPQATSFLRRAAEDDGDTEALRLLAASDDELALRRLLQIELDIRGQDKRLSYSIGDRLMQWPQDMVREAILKKLEGPGPVAGWLSVLQVFAKPADVPLFERFERGDDEAAADVAHDFLTSEAALRARTPRTVANPS